MNSFSQITPQIVTALTIAFTLTIIVYLAIIITIRPVPKTNDLIEGCFIIFGVGLIGACVGQISGLSRTPVAGTILPAVLTSIGGFGVYIFGNERATNRLVPTAVIIFVLGCYIAYLQSSVLRSAYDEINNCRILYAEAARSQAAGALQNTDQIFGEYCTKFMAKPSN